MFPRAMKSKFSTSNCGGCIGGNPSNPVVLTMAKELELLSSTYGKIGTNACICSHGDAFVCAKFIATGCWLLVGVVGVPILVVVCLSVPFYTLVVCKLGLAEVVVVESLKITISDNYVLSKRSSYLTY